MKLRSLGIGLFLIAALAATAWLLFGNRQPQPVESYDPVIAAARRSAEIARLDRERATGDFWAIVWPVCFLVLFGLLVWFIVIRLRLMTSRERHQQRVEIIEVTSAAKRLPADEQGNFPAILLADGDVISLPPGNVINPSPTTLHYHPTITHAPPPAGAPGAIVPSLNAPTSMSAAGLPSAPTFAQLAAQGFVATRDRMILGYTDAGPIYGKITDLLSVAIAGRPGQGKSTLLRFVYAQTVQAGGEVAIIDPHGSIIEDVKDAPRIFQATDEYEMIIYSGWLLKELNSRLKDYRAGRRDFPPILTLLDELPVIAMITKAAIEATGRIVLEGRKVGMFALISGQGLPAENFGGRLVRDALSSRYIFRTTPDEARRAGLSATQARLVSQLDIGRAIFAASASDPQIVAIPLTTGDDLNRLAPIVATPSSVDPLDLDSSEDAEPDGDDRDQPGPTGNTNPQPITGEEIDRAAELWEAGANSVRKLATAYPCSEWRARQLIAELRRQLIV
jgi:hypothetical protein